MSSGRLKILVAVTAALVLLLVVLQSGNSGSGRIDDPLYPDLRERINAATTISISRAGDADDIVIQKSADGWVSASRDDYPVDLGKVRALLLKLADARLIEQKTANPDNYAQLGVDDPANEGSKGARLTISGEDVRYDLVLGNVAQPGYRYARKFDAADSWLIDADPDLPATAADWLVTDIIDIKAGDIRAVTITHPDGEEIRIAKDSADDSDYSVADIPSGRELSYPSVANGIAGVLAALKFEDVRAGEPFTDDAVMTTFETFAGTLIEVRSKTDAGADWLTVRATGGTDSSEAEAINARTAGWQFRIASYKANQITRRWDDILKALPDAADSEE